MKRISINLVAVFAIMFFVTSCDQEDLYDDYGYNGYTDEWENPEGGSQGDGGDHDHEGGEGGGSIALTSYKISGNQITKIKDFEVSQDFLSYQSNIGTHQKMWEYYTTLIPLASRNYITEFIVFHGQGSLAGYVEPIDENDLSRWRMGLAIDITGDLDNINIQEEFAYTTIHEYAHVLTLNSSQVDVGGNPSTCPNFHTGEGCSQSNSYINALYELAWADIYEEALDAQDNPEAFYQKYKDRFVTDYAATNPGEDIAEVFAVFVTQNQQPTGNSIADQKINLMYNYPELVQLRNEIRSSNPVLRTMKPGSWVKKGRKHHFH